VVLAVMGELAIREQLDLEELQGMVVELVLVDFQALAEAEDLLEVIPVVLELFAQQVRRQELDLAVPVEMEQLEEDLVVMQLLSSLLLLPQAVVAAAEVDLVLEEMQVFQELQIQEMLERQQTQHQILELQLPQQHYIQLQYLLEVLLLFLGILNKYLQIIGLHYGTKKNIKDTSKNSSNL
jgi:hypothetical protein